jgi:hypothetical protein
MMRTTSFLVGLALDFIVARSSNLGWKHIEPHQIAILQFDSRPLELGKYWLTSALWNQYYTNRHGHRYLYFTLRDRTCRYNQTLDLYSSWCKVKAMIRVSNINLLPVLTLFQAHELFVGIKLFIFLDSDATYNIKFENSSLFGLLNVLDKKLQWIPHQKPLLFNQVSLEDHSSSLQFILLIGS